MRRSAGNLGVPVGLSVNWFQPAEDDLHSLGGQRVKLLWELEDLMAFNLLLLPHINKSNKDGGKHTVTSVGDRQDLHPATGGHSYITYIYPSLQISYRVISP